MSEPEFENPCRKCAKTLHDEMEKNDKGLLVICEQCLKNHGLLERYYISEEKKQGVKDD